MNSKIILILLASISTIFAYVNGPCSGRSGICVSTATCNNYGGTILNGFCPNDPSDIKCCDNIPCSSNGKSGNCLFTSSCSGEKADGKCPGDSDFKCCLGGSSGGQKYFGPCSSGGGACIDVNTVSCETHTVSGKCPGGSNVKCCVSGSRPSWYINQAEHPETICIINGEAHSVANAGCGIASLAMGIYAVTKKTLTPESLFREGYNNGYYQGGGFAHYQLDWVGKRHGVNLRWTDDINAVYTALEQGKGVIFHVRPENQYHFTRYGHYIFLYGVKTQNGIKKVYVFAPNGYNNYINVLFALKSSDGGIEVAKKGTGGDFAIVSKA